MEGKDWKKQLPPGMYNIPIGQPSSVSDDDIREFVKRISEGLKQGLANMTRPTEMSLQDRIDLSDSRARNATKNHLYEAARVHLSNSIKFRVENILNNFC